MKRKISFLTIKVVITILIITVLYSSLNKEDIVNSFTLSNKWYLLFAFLLLPINIISQIGKWFYVVRSVEKEISFIDIAKTTFIGIALGFITPGKSGEMAKFIFIKSKNRASLAGGSLYEKGLDTIWIPIFALLPFLDIIPSIDSDQLLARIIFPLIVIVSIIGISIIMYRVFKNKLGKQYRSIVSKVLNFYKLAGSLNFTKITLFSLLLYITYSFQLAILIVALSSTDFVTAYKISTFSILLKSLFPISFGDIGVREGASGFSATLFALSIECGALAGFILFFINVVIPSIIGAFLFFRRKGSE